MAKLAARLAGEGGVWCARAKPGGAERFNASRLSALTANFGVCVAGRLRVRPGGEWRK